MTRRAPRPTPTPAAHARAPWVWAAVGSVMGLALVLGLAAPAHWLAWGLAQASQQRVQLHDAQGTVWHGNAQFTLGTADPQAPRSALPGRVAWQLQPSWRGLRLELQMPCCLDGSWAWTLQPQGGGLQLKAQDRSPQRALRLPAKLLASLGTPWNTLQLQGMLALSTQTLVVSLTPGQLQLQGQLQLHALGLSTSLSTLQPIGSYQLRVQGGAEPTLELQTLEGALQLQGSGRLQAGRLQFTGFASAAAGREEALANLLNIIGRRDGARSVIQVG